MKTPLVSPKPAVDDPALVSLIEFYNETLGFCPNSIKTMHWRPEIARAFIEMNKAVMANHGRVTSGLKRLVAYVSSLTTGCRYCQAHAIRAAERYGIEEEQLNHVWEYKAHPAFNEAERSALDLAFHASTVPNQVDDAISARLRAHWDEGEIVELMGVISLFGYLNRWNDSMGTSIEEPAIESGEKHLKDAQWDSGKHQYANK